VQYQPGLDLTQMHSMRYINASEFILVWRLHRQSTRLRVAKHGRQCYSTSTFIMAMTAEIAWFRHCMLPSAVHRAVLEQLLSLPCADLLSAMSHTAVKAGDSPAALAHVQCIAWWPQVMVTDQW